MHLKKSQSFSAKLLSHMHAGSLLINTSRGELVDEDALVALLKTNKIADYASVVAAVL